MPRSLLLPAVVALSLAACSPPSTSAAPPVPPAPTATPAAPATIMPAETAPTVTPAPATAAPIEPGATPSAASISGAIREGNRPPPALRVCATPVGGGTSTCIETASGAASYRIEVAAGRYTLSGQTLGEPTLKFAHAERIRCIRAPCPPDTAIEVEVAAGEAKAGIDLTVGETVTQA